MSDLSFLILFLKSRSFSFEKSLYLSTHFSKHARTTRMHNEIRNLLFKVVMKARYNFNRVSIMSMGKCYG